MKEAINDGAVYLENLEELKTFCEEGGWDSIEELEKATGHARETFLNRWFTIMRDRVYDLDIDEEKEDIITR